VLQFTIKDPFGFILDVIFVPGDGGGRTLIFSSRAFDAALRPDLMEALFMKLAILA
jgi:hypothetical protein